MREMGYCSFPSMYDSAIREFDHATFVEVGVWAGASAEYMARKIRESGKHIKFYCVDMWVQTHEMGRVDGDMYEIFTSNMSHVNDYYIPIRSDSVGAALVFADRSVDFCFIDAAHDHESVSKDIGAWLPKVKPGGILAGHDIDIVFKAVDEALPGWRNAGENCWSYRKT